MLPTVLAGIKQLNKNKVHKNKEKIKMPITAAIVIRKKFYYKRPEFDD